MSTPIIQVQNISKLYHLGVIGTKSFKESVERLVYNAIGKKDKIKTIGANKLMIEANDPQSGPVPNSMWALKDISFSVQQGEILGIIGKNGAGKSTLLKILTRITEPTSGNAQLRGRVASLLEVGTGFHPELTGRENVFLNGTILGMRKKEIENKFADIVEFSGVSKYIDTPVKRYSSGMHVRLAFAVAAHLDPEILLIDEVLAVGDVEFQKKCLGKMEDVAKEGRTVLFVSHNMAAISSFCTKLIYLKNGRIEAIGKTSSVVSKYLSDSDENSKDNLEQMKQRKGSGDAKIKGFRILDKRSKQPLDIVLSGQDIIFEISIAIKKSIYTTYKEIYCGIQIQTATGTFITVLNNAPLNQKLESNTELFFCSVDHFPLMPGKYYVNLILGSNVTSIDVINNACSFTVQSGDFYGTGKINDYGRQGIFLMQSWT